MVDLYSEKKTRNTHFRQALLQTKCTNHTFLSGLAISGKTAQNGFTNSRNFTEKTKFSVKLYPSLDQARLSNHVPGLSYFSYS